MKTLYTILFVINSITLALLYYFLLKTAYAGHHPYKVAADIGGIIICIVILTCLLLKYSKLPPAR